MSAPEGKKSKEARKNDPLVLQRARRFVKRGPNALECQVRRESLLPKQKVKAIGRSRVLAAIETVVADTAPAVNPTAFAITPKCNPYPCAQKTAMGLGRFEQNRPAISFAKSPSEVRIFDMASSNIKQVVLRRRGHGWNTENREGSPW
jgi:hypothetical protein